MNYILYEYICIYDYILYEYICRKHKCECDKMIKSVISIYFIFILLVFLPQLKSSNMIAYKSQISNKYRRNLRRMTQSCLGKLFFKIFSMV